MKSDLVTSADPLKTFECCRFSQRGTSLKVLQDFNQSHLSVILVSDYLRREERKRQTGLASGCNCVYTTILLKRKKGIQVRGVIRSEALMR